MHDQELTHRHSDGTECTCDEEVHSAATTTAPHGQADSHMRGHPAGVRGDQPGHSKVAATTAHLVKDPVCGMDVDPSTAKHRADYAGQTYYFCSARCRERFVAEPGKYLAAEAIETGPIADSRTYT